MTGFEDVQVPEEYGGETRVLCGQSSLAGGQPLLLAFCFLQPGVAGWDVCADDLQRAGRTGIVIVAARVGR